MDNNKFINLIRSCIKDYKNQNGLVRMNRLKILNIKQLDVKEEVNKTFDDEDIKDRTNSMNTPNTRDNLSPKDFNTNEFVSFKFFWLLHFIIRIQWLSPKEEYLIKRFCLQMIYLNHYLMVRAKINDQI
jgi:hypothetical protein